MLQKNKLSVVSGAVAILLIVIGSAFSQSFVLFFGLGILTASLITLKK